MSTPTKSQGTKATPSKKLAQAKAPLPSRRCANPTCTVIFTPVRRDQIWHSTECRDTYYAVARDRHECPVCGAIHRSAVVKQPKPAESLPEAAYRDGYLGG